MFSIINPSFNNSTDQTQMNPNVLRPGRAFLSHQNSLDCVTVALMECCRRQLRTIPKYLSWCQPKLKQPHGAMQHRERPFQVLSYSGSRAFLAFLAVLGVSSLSFMLQACPEVKERILKKGKKDNAYNSGLSKLVLRTWFHCNLCT